MTINISTLEHRSAGLSRRQPWACFRPATLAGTVIEWRRRQRYRKDLQRLLNAGVYLVRDLGLAPGEARREVSKPFWQA